MLHAAFWVVYNRSMTKQFSFQRPYCILPKLVEQPTWGGQYICKLKGWQSRQSYSKKLIGQSYELSGKSCLSLYVSDTRDADFFPEHDAAPSNAISISQLIESNPLEVLGPNVASRFTSMPLLIKLTQALGNSFQLHIPQHASHSRWAPKAESWFFLEPGLVTLGVREDASMKVFQDACKKIENYMRQLSRSVQEEGLPIADARKQAGIFIKRQNPWQFVNTHRVQKGTLLDLSEGGLHHSWEEDTVSGWLGNVVYEIQQDVDDEHSTLRCFDQGKMKDSGEIREVNIEDYFAFLNADPAYNALQAHKATPNGERLLSTPLYCLDQITVERSRRCEMAHSFRHLYVQEGDVSVQAKDGTVRVTQGHSCLLPYGVGSYSLLSNSAKSVILQTSIEQIN